MLIAHIGAMIVATSWGTSFLSTKVLMHPSGLFTPVEMFVYRFAAAYLILLLFTFRNIRSNNWKDEFTFMLCGICSGSLYFITENFALQNTTTGNVSLLASISPIFTTILMAIIYRQRILPGVIIGSIVSFAGAACIILSNGDGLSINPKGDLLALSAALSWAIYTVAIKRVLPHYSGFFVTRKLFFYGVICSPSTSLPAGTNPIRRSLRLLSTQNFPQFHVPRRHVFALCLRHLERSHENPRPRYFQQLPLRPAFSHYDRRFLHPRRKHISFRIYRMRSYHRWAHLFR